MLGAFLLGCVVSVWFCAFFIVGIWLWPYWEPAQESLRIGAVSLFVVAWFCRQQKIWMLSMSLAFFFAGGVAVASLPSSKVPRYGSVLGEVKVRTGRFALIETESGRIWGSFFGRSPQTGSQIVARMRPSPPAMVWPGEPSDKWFIKRIHAAPRKIIAWQHLFPNDQKPALTQGSFRNMKNGALSMALLSGDRSEISKDTSNLLRRTGVSHLLAISGMHIGMLSAFVYGLVKLMIYPLIFRGMTWPLVLPPGLGFLSACCYSVYSGWSAAAQRSLIMIGVAMIAISMGRRLCPWFAMGCAASLVLAIEPAHFGTLGFSLSFSAVGGIFLLSPQLIRFIPKDFSLPLKWILSAMAVSLAACIGTLPLTALYFQIFPWVSPLANLIAVPLVSCLILPGSVLGAIFPDPLSSIVLIGVDRVIDLLFFCLELLDNPPIVTAIGVFESVGLGLVIVVLKKMRFILPIAAVLFFRPPETPNGFRLTVLPVGQGDGALLEWSNGVRWLVDAGSNHRPLLKYLRRRRISKIDAMILSHPHPDHSGGMLGLLPHIKVSGFWTVRPPEGKEIHYQTLWRGLNRAEIPVYGPEDQLGQQALIVHPTEGWSASGKRRVNEESLVVSIKYGGRRLLMTGDIESQAEAHLSTQLTPHDVLKVAHHGSRSSSSEAFLDTLSPTVSLISCGINNRFGHPHPVVLNRLRRTRIYRTDETGILTVNFSPKGEITVASGSRWDVF